MVVGKIEISENNADLHVGSKNCISSDTDFERNKFRVMLLLLYVSS